MGNTNIQWACVGPETAGAGVRYSSKSASCQTAVSTAKRLDEKLASLESLTQRNVTPSTEHINGFLAYKLGAGEFGRPRTIAAYRFPCTSRTASS